MRLLYLVLKRMIDSQPIFEKNYRMSNHEFNLFLQFIQKEGYISGFELQKPNYSNIKVSEKGNEFLNQYCRYENELPVQPDEISRWIRFEGETYVPKNKKLRASDETLNLIDFNEWKSLIDFTLDKCKRHGADIKLVIGDTSTEGEIVNLEQKLKIKLPEEFKNVLLHFSGSLDYYWYLSPDKGCRIVDATYGMETIIHTGGFLDSPMWGVEDLLHLDEMRRDHDYLDDDHDRKYWKYSLVFARDGAGNYFGIDLKYNVGEVIYLSSDYDLHGYRLAQNFVSYIDNWLRIGCAGHFGKDFRMFTTNDVPYINHESPNAIRIKNWLFTKNA